MTSRREFLTAVPLSAAGVAIAVRPDRAMSAAWPGFPRQDPALVSETVGASHGRIARVKELVEDHPALANAALDWGFGDWETALGAAAHTGQREIAEYLISKGARVDIFAAAMLGRLEAVKDFVAATPGIQRTKGPHGIPLLSHANAGGEPATAVAEFLKELGDAGDGPSSIPLTHTIDVYPGEYSFGPAEGDRFRIASRDGRLTFQYGEGPFRFLFHVGDGEFHPAGAPAVRFRFLLEGVAASGVTIKDGALTLAAQRRA